MRRQAGGAGGLPKPVGRSPGSVWVHRLHRLTGQLKVQFAGAAEGALAARWRWVGVIQLPPWGGAFSTCIAAVLRRGMGARESKPEAPVPSPRPPLERPSLSGFSPRSSIARRACHLKRVRRLILSGRLGPCWSELFVGQGEVN